MNEPFESIDRPILTVTCNFSSSCYKRLFINVVFIVAVAVAAVVVSRFDVVVSLTVENNCKILYGYNKWQHEMKREKTDAIFFSLD